MPGGGSSGKLGQTREVTRGEDRVFLFRRTGSSLFGKTFSITFRYLPAVRGIWEALISGTGGGQANRSFFENFPITLLHWKGKCDTAKDGASEVSSARRVLLSA